ncbi:MAG: nucleotidyltransferase family protein [Planctomycetota bacterium]|nr:nucleotidyltransferase family protein [Planctomycetota bacterium]
MSLFASAKTLCAQYDLQNHILKVLREHRREIRSLGVRNLSLFGSCARGEETADSDPDFVVEFDVKSFDAYMDLNFFLEELFGRHVDLVLADAIKPRLRDNIMKELIHATGL